MLLSIQKFNSAKLLQAQQPSVQYTVKICLNVSCHSPLLSYNTTELIQWHLQSSLNCIDWLTRCFVFIYTPNTADIDLFARIYFVTGSYVLRDWRFYCERSTKVYFGCSNYITNGLQLSLLANRWVVLTVLENYLLRVEHFGNLIQVLMIPNSKLSVTVYICMYVCMYVYMYTHGETVIYLDSQIINSFKFVTKSYCVL